MFGKQKTMETMNWAKIVEIFEMTASGKGLDMIEFLHCDKKMFRS